jgi:pimeloyl-ACP methyl ester carboxylesterase
MTSTSEDFAGDVLAGIDFLKSRPEIDSARIGLIGHSEGGIIAPMVAARSKDVAFIVLLAGTGLPGDEIVSRQRTLILAAMGIKDDPEKGRDLQRRLLEVAKGEKDDRAAAEKIRTIIKEALADLPESDQEKRDDANRRIEFQIATLLTPWTRFFLTYDPRPTLSRVRCPVLALCGEKDLQVAPAENLDAIEKALRESGNDRVTIKVLPRLNHLFQTSDSGAPSEYATIEETIAPSALTLIGDWIGEQVGATR